MVTTWDEDLIRLACGSRWSLKFLPGISLFFHNSAQKAPISCHFFPEFPKIFATKMPFSKARLTELPPNGHKNYRPLRRSSSSRIYLNFRTEDTFITTRCNAIFFRKNFYYAVQHFVSPAVYPSLSARGRYPVV